MANDMYSALVEDQDIVGFFFADHVIGEPPRKTIIPVIDLLSIGSLAQSASQYVGWKI